MSTQISAHFGRPTRRRNSLREKLVNDQQVHPKNLISLNPSSSENLNYDSVRESDFNHGFVNDIVVETSSSVGESKLKPLGESILSSKLENWTDQYKKDVDYWGIGSGPIFTVFQDSEGTVKKVLVDEDEILKRTQVKGREFEDLSKINSRILYAKSLAREMESGENVIPRNSSVAKFVVSGKESGFVDIVRGVIPGPEFVPKLSTVGRVVLFGLVVFWVGRKLISFKKKGVHHTELVKEMMRRKINSRKEKEMLEKGSMQVFRGSTETEVTFEKPKINKEELVKNIMKASGSEDKLALENSSCSRTRGSKGFDDKILEIREMARRAHAIEAEELSQVDAVEEERQAVDEELSDEIEEVKQQNENYVSVLSNLSNGGPEQESDTDVTVVTTFLDEAKSLNTEFSNKVPSVKKVFVQASGASSLEVSREWPKTNQDNESTLGLAVQSSGTLQSESCMVETNSEKRKPKVIRSVKEAREFLSNICNKPEFHQPLVKTLPESGNVLTQPSDIDCDRNTSQVLDVDNVGSTTFGGTSESKHTPDASENSTWKDKEHVPMKKNDPEYADEVNGGDGRKSPISFDHEYIGGSAKTGPSLKMENWIEKNFHEIEPMVKKIGVGFRDNFKAAREKVNQHLDTYDDITQLISGEDDSELEWMKDDRLREIVFQVRDNELSGRDPFHLMDTEDKLAFFKGLEKKVEKQNEKLLPLHEYLHSNIENLDYGADGISVYDPPEKIIPRWKGPPLEKNPEFLDDFLKQRKALFVGNTDSSYPVKKDEENFLQNPTESPTHENDATSLARKKEIQDNDPKHSKTVIEGSDGSVKPGKKYGKEFWQYTKKWSRGFLESYNAETDPEVKSVMKDIGKDLDRWITEEEIQESAYLMTNLRERNKKFMEKKINKLKREMDLFGPQAVVSKYREYAEEKEEDYLWWLDLPHVLCIELYTVEEGEQRVGFYSLEMATDLELEPKPHHVIAFEDASDCKNLCYIIQGHLEMLGTGHAFVVPRPPKDAFWEAKANGFSVTVIRRGELQLNVDQTLEAVEEQITEIGSKIYHDAIMKERSVDISSIMKGVLGGGGKPTKRKRAKRKLKRPGMK